jgi:hypothetical protein
VVGSYGVHVIRPESNLGLFLPRDGALAPGSKTGLARVMSIPYINTTDAPSGTASYADIGSLDGIALSEGVVFDDPKGRWRGELCGQAHIYNNCVTYAPDGGVMVGEPGNGAIILALKQGSMYGMYALTLGVNGSWD